MKNQKENQTCELCDFPESCTLIDGDTTYKLCPNHLLSLVELRLSVKEAKKLIQKHGNQTFYLHEDFYDEQGHALQPK